MAPTNQCIDREHLCRKAKLQAWRPVRGKPCFSPCGRWLQPLCNPQLDKRKKMDRWNLFAESLMYLFLFSNFGCFGPPYSQGCFILSKRKVFPWQQTSTIVTKLLPVSMEIWYVVVASDMVKSISLFLLFLSFVLFVCSCCKAPSTVNLFWHCQATNEMTARLEVTRC